jgi:GH15 family glucan-1,4-alpha-glucosidase
VTSTPPSKRSPRRRGDSRYPPISDYGLIGDCHSAALVSRSASIDWCCVPRFDSGSVFGRLLDWDTGGFCQVFPSKGNPRVSREYVPGTLVLVTTVTIGGGECRIYDCFTMRRGGKLNPNRQLLRIVEGLRGTIELRISVCPRFDYGEVRPWIRQHGVRVYSAIGGNDALVVTSDAEIAPSRNHDILAVAAVRPGERVRLSIQYVGPETLEFEPPPTADPEELDRRLEETIKWWKRWSSRLAVEDPHRADVERSAIVLKGLTHAPTGAIAAAPTTSLPEVPGGSSNWDYRYSWIRDSCFAVRSLAELSFEAEAEGFRRFAQRSSAGHAAELQVMYGVGGERRLLEYTLEDLDGYGGARPVRVGNGAAGQLQLDAYGLLVDLAWRWHRRGFSPDDDYWRFLVDLVNMAAERWSERDSGIWEVRGNPQHFVHSKAMCWTALQRGLDLARECGRKAPERRWTKTRDEIRGAVETRGYRKRRGVFVRAFGSSDMDAALLLLPVFGFVDWKDERMVRTTDAVWEDLEEGGLLRRYRAGNDPGGREGVFVACSFWLAECLARQDRHPEASEVFDRAVSTANDLGLFSEEYDTGSSEMLGNFPQGLTHLSHIAAAVALVGGGE